VSDPIKLPSGTIYYGLERFTHKDGSITNEELWVFLPKGFGERRFLGLCSEMSADDACAKVQS